MVIRQVVTIVVQASKIVVQTTKTWHSTLPSANSVIRKSVEHGGFEPPTPCLPGKCEYVQIRGIEIELCPLVYLAYRPVSL